MAPKKITEHSNDRRTLLVRHIHNGDSLGEIAAKALLSRSTVLYMVDKYKSTKCIDNLFGRLRSKRKTRATTNRLILRKLKLYRRKSASTVKVEVENELEISLLVDTIRKRAHEVELFGRVARKKPYVNKINQENSLNSPRKCLKSQWIFGRTLFGPTSENSIFSGRMVK